MKGSLRMVAVLMLVSMAAALPGAHAHAFPAAQTGHPAGCHSHGAAPAPAPTSYQCCVSGHRAAIPNPSFAPRSLVAQVSGLENGENLGSGVVPYRHSAVFVVPSDSPPRTAPLRI
jgi:hypothetical protein